MSKSTEVETEQKLTKTSLTSSSRHVYSPMEKSNEKEKEN